MNRARRKNIQDIAEQLTELKSALEDILSEEETYRDNIPENLQGSERYEASDAACDTLGEAAEALEDVISCLSELAEG